MLHYNELPASQSADFLRPSLFRAIRGLIAFRDPCVGWKVILGHSKTSLVRKTAFPRLLFPVHAYKVAAEPTSYDRFFEVARVLAPALEVREYQSYKKPPTLVPVPVGEFFAEGDFFEFADGGARDFGMTTRAGATTALGNGRRAARTPPCATGLG